MARNKEEKMTRNIIIGASALALMAGTAHAQVSYSLGGNTWTPPDNESAYTDQDGDNNEAFVDQADGEEGVSFIKQDNTDGGDGHYADVKQSDGTGTSPTFSYPNNVSMVNQQGDGEGFALVTQENNNQITPPAGPNTVLIDQDSLTDGNPLLGAIDRDGNAIGQNGDQFNAVAYADQLGAGNNLVVRQVGSANWADSDQTGDDNDSRIRQSDDSFVGNGVNTAMVEQDGDRNFSAVDQERLGFSLGNQMADVLQMGDDNDSRVRQRTPLGGDQLAEIRQMGNSDFSSVDQEFSVIGRNRAFVRQEGVLTGSESRINQEDGFNVARVDQKGDEHDSRIRQSSLDDDGPGLLGRNRAVVNQEGTGHSSVVDQSSPFSLSARTRAFVDQIGGSGNSSIVRQAATEEVGAPTPEVQYAEVTQTNSTDSSSVIRQNDFDQRAWVTQVAAINSSSIIDQFGDEGEATVDQTGSDHTSRILQDGSWNNAMVDQSGDGNDSVVRQFGGYNDADVLQTGMDGNSVIVQDGNRNMADLNQAGSNNDSLIRQTGDDNEADVDQLASASGSLSEIFQDGMDNEAIVTQSATSYSLIEQTGNGNYANHSQ